MARADQRLRRFRRAIWLSFIGAIALAAGCTGVLQNLGARWVTNKISGVFDLDDEQRTATRAAVDRAIDEAPELLGPRLDLLVATVDRSLAKGMSEQNMLIIERQVDLLMDKAVAWIIDEAAPILATLRDFGVTLTVTGSVNRRRESCTMFGGKVAEKNIDWRSSGS